MFLAQGKTFFQLVRISKSPYIGDVNRSAEELVMAVRSARNIEKQKKKKRRVIPRAKVTRIQGNTLGARRRLKKMAGKARVAKAAAAKA
jgi:hypothetical protein